MFGTGTNETPADRFRRRAADLVGTARAVPADRWDDPSTCDDWTVRDVARHVVDVQGMFAGFIDRTIDGVPSVDDDPVGALEGALAQTQANLDDAEVASTGYDGHFGPTTYESSVDRYASADLLIHRWDLGTGAGVPVRLDDRDVSASLEDVAAIEEPMRSAMRGPGAFGPELEAPDGADGQAQLLAFLGRQGW
jgi:uncharacterized protein (TIGR03086 family)